MPRPHVLPAGLRWTIIILLLAEVLFRLPGAWELVPESDTGEVASTTRSMIHATQPRVIFLGSSRMRDAVAPRLVEQELGLPTGAVVNLGVSSGRPSDALTIYERHRTLFARASVVIYGVEGWQFNAMTASKRFRTHADLLARLTFPDRTAAADYTLGWFVKLWDGREVLKQYWSLLSAKSFPGPWYAVDRYGMLAVHDETAEAAAPVTPNAKPVSELVTLHFGQYKYWDYEVRSLARLLSEARADGNGKLKVHHFGHQEVHHAAT